MKKLFVFAASAMMVFASCTDNEIVYQNETPQEISLFSVVDNMTRGAQTATGGFEHSNMIVAAYLAPGDGVTAGDYFKDAPFTGTPADGTNAAGNFTGGKYWPIEAATLNFMAVAPEVGTVAEAGTLNSGVKTTFVSVNTADEDETPVIQGKATVKVANNYENQHDVMYATVRASKNINAANYTPNAVGMSFQHALAWVNFTFKATTPGIKINSITINDAIYDGTLTVIAENYGVADVALSTNATSWTEKSEAADNIVSGDVLDLVIEDDADESDVLTWGESDTSRGGILVVPCNPTSFVINYSVTVGTDTHTYNYTYPITEPEEGTAWAMGKKYNYNITMGLQEIKISPTVATWTDGTGADITIQ